MAKIGIFKKVAALATAIAIVVCFAVSAGAVTVTTTTSYVDGNDGDILVEVTITADDNDILDKSVSYYAYNNEGPVYIDQIEEGTATVTFDYVTDSADLNSAVKVGYTGASEATPSQIDGNTVTWGDAVAYIPTKATEATVTFETEATDVLSYDAEGADIVSIIPVPGESLTVVLEHIDGPVTLDIQVKAQATAQIIDAAYVISNGSDDISTKPGSEGAFADTIAGQDKKLTAIAKVTGSEVYGVIVSETAEYTTDDMFQAAGKTADGYFAVQLIDVEGDEYVLLDKNTYVVAAYSGDTVSAETKTVTLVDLNNKN